MQSRQLAPAAPTSRWLRKYYFSLVSAFILALSLWSFSDNLIWNVGQKSNHDPKFIIHGLFCLAWVLMLFVQANLVRAGNVRLHRTLGVVGLIAAVGVTLSTIHIFVVVWKGWDAMAFYLKANRLLLPSYALLVLLGYLNRKRRDWHRRFVYIATLFMLEPVLSRAFDPLEPLLTGLSESQIDFYWWIFFVLVWNSLFLSLFVYDWIVEKRIHPVTAGGFAWFCAIWAVVLLV
ncbi:hypothetical protein [Nevskia sp.]|uniref:hypothetical protein n=1 Tax=Nevskia sp. TaxID=1929292 RepID=UPI0025F3218E|nr:hypothetical protein [Nevskia sp.]